MFCSSVPCNHAEQVAFYIGYCLSHGMILTVISLFLYLCNHPPWLRGNECWWRKTWLNTVIWTLLGLVCLVEISSYLLDSCLQPSLLCLCRCKVIFISPCAMESESIFWLYVWALLFVAQSLYLYLHGSVCHRVCLKRGVVTCVLCMVIQRKPVELWLWKLVSC